MLIRQVTEKILHLEFSNKKDMCEHLLRFQEYYESPEFHGKIFTIGQFKSWYTNFYGLFDYFETVEGMNIPSSVLEPFVSGLFEPLTKKEAKIIEMFGKRKGTFYLFATAKDSSTDIYEHELLHSIFGTNDKYRKEVLGLLSQYNLKNLKDWLKDMGYAEKVALDEIHAYIGACSQFLNEEGIKYPKDLTYKLQEIKSRYLP